MSSVTAPSRPRRRVLITVIAAAAAIVLSGCSPAASPTPADDQAASGLLAEYGLAGLEASEVIDRLDRTPIDDRPEGLIAQILPDAIVLADDAEEITLPLPDGQVYLAIAPYRDQTHPCTFHAPNGCIGELSDTAVEVTITDQRSGEVYLDATTRTYDNGFIGVWLPRDIAADVTMTVDGQTATGQITTGSTDPTCITTLRLA